MIIIGNYCNTEKDMNVALCSIYGINTVTANKICAMIGVARGVPLNKVSSDKVSALKSLCREHIDSTLSLKTREHIKCLINIKNYRGSRHMFGLPARGQRTRTNARTPRKLSFIKRQQSQQKQQKQQKQKQKQHKPKPKGFGKVKNR
jgi:small subunit ribosomal protein S13